LGTHVVFNLNSIKNLIQTGFVQFHEGQMEASGLNFGKATKNILFWDL